MTIASAQQPTSVDHIRDLVREAHDSSSPLRVVGRGLWLDGGGPVVEHATRVDLSGLSGIVEYVPGDLTLTARAGTTLGEIDAATAPYGQWCTLFPWGTDEGSLGATMATASCGPCHRSFGGPRDIALGLQCVDGTGALIRAGGRVVKNVAGFDLTRLMVGSWGALGVITEVSVRLRARPVLDESWAVSLDLENAIGQRAISDFERGPFAPLSCEPLDADTSAALDLPKDVRLLVRIGGNAQFMEAARAAVRSLGEASRTENAVWTRYRALDPHPRRIPTNALADPLAQRVKAQFDPRGVLNPGILGEPSI